MEKEFKNRIALVTGSSKGIGKGIAIALGQNGADVVINYYSDKEGALDAKVKIEEFGVKAIAIKADVGKYKDVRNMFWNATKFNPKNAPWYFNK